MDALGSDEEKDTENNTEEDTEKDAEKDEDAEKDASGNDVRPTDWKDTNSWVSFVKLLFHFFIITLLLGLFGSSFIYLTTRGSDLDTILPTDDQFYSAKSYQVQKKGPSNVIECSETSTGMFSAFEDNFPYNLIKIKGSPTKEQLKTLTMVERMTTWFAKCVAGCFKSNRALLKGWLDNFGPEGPLGNHVFQIYIAAPFTILISFVALITGFWAAFGAGVSADLKVTVWGGFLLYSWGLFGGLAGILFLRMIGTICFYPMSQNWKEVANIMACNVKPLVVLFGFFVCGAAYDTLEPTMAGIMGIVYLCLVAWTVWKYFSSQLF
jgi:hypothetical protein